jgi:CheY-like chemotaxis protein
MISVRDDGVGIAPQMLPRVFDMFAQERPPDTRAEGGLGIGLTLARGLVELHGGTISADSPGPGLGSTFTIRLPGPVGSPSDHTRPGPAVPRPPARRVLVVDDVPDSVESLSTLLRLLGQEVRAAYDGPEAIRVAEDFQPDLILLDIGMPGMSGLDVCRELRKRPATSRTRIVALTGYGQEEDRRRSKEAGFDRHIVKPLDPDALDDLLSA